MIKLCNVSRSYGEKAVIDRLNFTFPDTGVFSLMGPSGCGKTTLLRLLASLDRPNGGSIHSTHQKVAFAFQEPRLVPFLNCENNLKLVLPKDNIGSNLAKEWLEKTELANAAALYPAALSGGMQQRLSLARALAVGADLILLDEPFSALDEELKQRIAKSILPLAKSALILLITHDRDEAALLGAKILDCVGDPLSQLLPS